MPKRKDAAQILSRTQIRLSSIVNTPIVRRRLVRRPAAPSECPFAVYFADSVQGVYQLEQWLLPLERLAATGTPVSLIIANANVAARVAGATDLPIVLCTQSLTVEQFVVSHHVQVIFYLNNNQANFTTLRINGPYHVHLSHGESEKASMVSNQLKAYDRAFIAGPASRERILRHVNRIDPSHLVEIGRPQLDLHTHAASKVPAKPVVLYAPTWEGDDPSMAYSSLAGSGLELIRALGHDGRLELIFRPHPKTGTKSSEFARALRQAKKLLGEGAASASRRARPSTRSRDALADIELADVVITDISAMAMDSVGFCKPTLVLSENAIPAVGSDLQLTECVNAWSSIPSGAADLILDLARTSPDERQMAFRDHVFGAPALGTGIERFIHAAKSMLNFDAK